MDSSELTADQCRAIQARVREQQYFDKLLARMTDQGFPPTDPLREDAQAMQGGLLASVGEMARILLTLPIEGCYAHRVSQAT